MFDDIDKIFNYKRDMLITDKNIVNLVIMLKVKG